MQRSVLQSCVYERIRTENCGGTLSLERHSARARGARGTDFEPAALSCDSTACEISYSAPFVSTLAMAQQGRPPPKPLSQLELDACRDAFIACDTERRGSIDVFDMGLVRCAVGARASSPGAAAAITHPAARRAGARSHGRAADRAGALYAHLLCGRALPRPPVVCERGRRKNGSRAARSLACCAFRLPRPPGAARRASSCA